MDVMLLASRKFVILIATAYATYRISKLIHRLVLGPLAGIPGPKLAAATSFYAFFHDVVRGGQFIWVIEKMHKEYGPIVQIRPNVLHINDANYINEVYTNNDRKRDKSAYSVNGFTMPSTIIATGDDDLHRRRRGPLNTYFSINNTHILQPILQHHLNKLLSRMSQEAGSGIPVDLSLLFKAVVFDIISHYAYGSSTDTLDDKTLNKVFFDSAVRSEKAYTFKTFMPAGLLALAKSVPLSAGASVYPKFQILIQLRKFIQEQLEKVATSDDSTSLPTMFEGILNDPDISESDKVHTRVIDEARVILTTGTLPTAYTLAGITYEILSSSETLTKLKADLRAAGINEGDPLYIDRLRKSPYLTAVVKEGLRLYPGFGLRQERVAPLEDLVYEDQRTGKRHLIPAGTTICMTAPLLGRVESVYEAPDEFRPERWLGEADLDQYQLAFSRGSRECVGKELAQSILLYVIAGIFMDCDVDNGTTGPENRLTLDLYQTKKEDVRMSAVFLLSTVRKESLGLRALVGKMTAHK